MKRISQVFFFVLVLNFSALPALAENAGSAVDEREVLRLSPLQREHVLGEMRALLRGVQDILAALAADDMAAVAAIARPLGSSMAGKAEDHLKGVLPKGFMQLGMAAHKDFDSLAALADSGADGSEILRQLSNSMNKCQACHSSYQIQSANNTGAKEKAQHHGH